MPFSSDSFTSNSQGDSQHPVTRQPVKIATFHQYGPVPIPFTTRDEGEERARRRIRRTKKDVEGGLMENISRPLEVTLW